MTAAAVALGGSPALAACKLVKTAEIPVTMRGTTPMVKGVVDGVELNFIADTGAFYSMLTPQAVARLGMKTRSTPMSFGVVGVGGEVRAELGEAKTFVLGGMVAHRVPFFVNPSHIEHIADGLIGQNVWGPQDAEIDLAHGVIRLYQPSDCARTNLAYWTQGGPFNVIDIHQINAEQQKIEAGASVNGQRIRVQFDTGAGLSVLTLAAAGRAGVTIKDEGVQPGGETGGIGPRLVETWIAPVKSFAIGDEEIRNTRLRIGQLTLGDEDMLLGADFFLSHRVFVSNVQHKLYFTYNGGPVFNLSTTPQAGSAAAAPASETPGDASGFLRRGLASEARGDLVRANEDFDLAIQLEPDLADAWAARASIRSRQGQADKALADLDQAVRLRPQNARTLVHRATVRLAAKDLKGAREDFDAAVAIEADLSQEAAGTFVIKGMFDEALPYLDAWIATHPKDDNLAGALNARCWARALWGRELDKAMSDCNAALKLRPGAPTVLDSRGLVRLRQGDLDGAVADYDQALRRDPKMAWSLYGRGLARLRKGLAAAGEADLKAAAAIEADIDERAKTYGLERASAASPTVGAERGG